MAFKGEIPGPAEAEDFHVPNKEGPPGTLPIVSDTDHHQQEDGLGSAAVPIEQLGVGKHYPRRIHDPEGRRTFSEEDYRDVVNQRDAESAERRRRRRDTLSGNPFGGIGSNLK